MKSKSNILGIVALIVLVACQAFSGSFVAPPQPNQATGGTCSATDSKFGLLTRQADETKIGFSPFAVTNAPPPRWPEFYLESSSAITDSVDHTYSGVYSILNHFGGYWYDDTYSIATTYRFATTDHAIWNRTNRLQTNLVASGTRTVNQTRSGNVGDYPYEIFGVFNRAPGPYSETNNCTGTRSNGVWDAFCDLSYMAYPPFTNVYVPHTTSKTNRTSEYSHSGANGMFYQNLPYLTYWCDSVTANKSYKSTEELAEEYTTPMLVADVQAKLNRAGYPTNEMGEIVYESGGSQLAAKSMARLTLDQTGISASDALYSLEISVAPGSKYTLKYFKVTTRYYLKDATGDTTGIPGNAISAPAGDVSALGGDLNTATNGTWYVSIENTPMEILIDGSSGSNGKYTLAGKLDVPDVGGNNYYTTVELTTAAGQYTKQPCYTTAGSQYTYCSMPFGRMALNNSSVGLHLGLGTVEGGTTAGYLYVKEELPSASLFLLSSLKLVIDTNRVVVTRDGGGNLATLTSGDGHVIFEATNQLGYALHCYPVADGEPVMDDGPVVSYQVLNVSATTNSYDKMRIVEIHGANRITNEFQWVTNNRAWALSEGNGLRKTVKKSTYSPDNTLRYEGLEILNVDDSLAFKSRNTYRLSSHGELLLETIVGTGPSAQVTSYGYDTNGWVTQVNNANGSWTIYQYDTGGRITRTYSAFQNQGPTTDDTLCRRMDYSYTPISGSGDDGTYHPNSARQITTYLLGHEISRKYYVYQQFEDRTIECPDPGLAWNNTNNLVTVSKTYDAGTYQGYAKSVTMPNGTMTIYEYGTNVSGQKVTTVYTGAPGTGGTNIVDGQKTVATQGTLGETLTVLTKDIVSDITTASMIYTNFDEFNRPLKTIYLDGSYETVSYSCCNIESQTDRTGITTSYGYDALKRQVSSTTLGISQINVMDGAGRTLQSIVQGTNGTQIITAQATYDAAGRVIASYDAYTNLTSHAYGTNSTGERIETTTYPDGAVRKEVNFRDGSTDRIEGTAVYAERMEQGVTSDGGYWRETTKDIKVKEDGTDSREWTMLYADGMDRSYKKAYADGAYEQSSYNSKGQVWKMRDADGVITLQQYNSKGDQEYSVIDMNRDDVINFNGSDRIIRTLVDVVSYQGVDAVRARKYVWNAEGVDSSSLAEELVQAVDRHRKWTVNYGVTNTIWQVCELTNGICWVTNRTAAGVYSVSKSLGDRTLLSTQFDSNAVQTASVGHAYDEFGRLQETLDAHAGATTYVYDLSSRVITVFLPPSIIGGTRQAMTNIYDVSGRVIRAVKPDGAVVTSEYYLTGLLKRTYGSRTYPIQYTYDYMGRTKTMTTWQDFTGQRGAAITVWNYDTQRGFMIGKRYVDGKGPDYAYTSAGRLAGMTWARGTTVAYGRNNAGDVVLVDYGDLTPDIGYRYDRQGRQEGVSDGIGGMLRTFAESGALLTEKYTNGLLAGLVLSNSYDGLLRRAGFTLKTNATPLYNTAYSYDAASRYSTITDGTNSATYSYVTNADLMAGVVFKQNGTERMTMGKQYDGLNRLTNITSTTASFTSSSAYLYNAANQRVRQTREDGSYWVYGYDGLGQVTSGKKYWADGTEVKGMQYEYGFDDIGNRQQTVKEGRRLDYSCNLLNQYAQRTVPGVVDVLGTVRTNAIISVNGISAERKGSYFWVGVPFENRTNPVWGEVETLAIYRAGLTNDVVTTNKGHIFLPQTPEQNTYDADGNLLADGQWTYMWDGENRLVQMETRASAVAAGTPKQKLVYGYDHISRRLSKAVYLWSGGSYMLQDATLNQYDGWNLIAEFDVTTVMTLSRTYLWGQDLSGGLTGAGGVGGLLAINHVGSDTSHYAIYDGNGNVVGLAAAGNGGQSAVYEYGPYGELIRITEATGAGNPFRFSTKYQDAESGLLYYGYRYYSPKTGSWIVRDPLMELASRNIYAFNENQGVNKVDILGLISAGEIDAGRHEYSCNCGWIDWDHVKWLKANTLTLSEKITKLKGNFSGNFTALTTTATKLGLTAKIDTDAYVWLRGDYTADEAKQVAMAILKEASITYEGWQGEWGAGGSSFSGEDLPSNLLGIYAGLEGYDLDKIGKDCKVVGKEMSKLLLAQINMSGGIPKNKTFSPINYNNQFCGMCPDKGKMEWPYNSIKDADSGSLWKKYKFFTGATPL